MKRAAWTALSLLTFVIPALTTANAATHVTATYGLPANPVVMATVNGTSEYGLIFVERNEAVTWNTVEYGKTTLEGYLNASGQLNDGAGNLYLDIVPDTDASPGGSYYVVTVNIQGQVHSEIWVAPDETTVDATLIRQTQPPGAAGTTLFYQSVENAGAALAQRQALNFAGTGVSCADDAALGRTDCTITAGAGGGGSGTVTSFSAGGLAPLFGATVANATTTPALTFSLSSAPANSWFGNATGASAAPSYNTSTIPASLIPALNYQTPLPSYAAPSHEFLTGFTAPGTFTAAQPAYSDLSGTPQLANNFSALSHEWLNSYSASTGNFAATQPGFSDLSGSVATSQQPSTTVNSVTNDTNVTGSISSQDLTLGWTGTLATSRGGTGASSLSGANIPVQSGAITTGDCVKWASGTSITDAGAGCGGGGSGPTLQTNGTNNSSQTTLNIENGGNITVANPSGGNVQVNFNPLDTSVITLRDEFVGMTRGSAFGELGWQCGGSGGGCQSNTAAWPHVGVIDTYTAATASASRYFFLSGSASGNQFGALGSNTNWECVIVFELGQTTNTRFYVGFWDQSATPRAINGIWLRYDTNATYADSAFKAETCAASTCTVGATTYTVNTSWHKLDIKSTTAGQITFSLDGAGPQTITTNVPTSSLTPFLECGSDTSAVNTIASYNLWAFSATGVSR